MNLAYLREEYGERSLSKSSAPTNPLELFETWFQETLAANIPTPNAMALGTSINGQPSVRIVLLKGLDERGFVFYTNYQSRKGTELSLNPKAALTFFWPLINRQVRIEGSISKVSSEESDAYFQTRSKGSQLGAWGSSQSSVIANRAMLHEQVQKLEKQYKNEASVPRPPHWGGFRLAPHRIEFWQGRNNRLHDRIVYTLTENRSWKIERLAP